MEKKEKDYRVYNEISVCEKKYKEENHEDNTIEINGNETLSKKALKKSLEYAKKGKYRRALRIIKKSIKLDPFNPFLYQMRIFYLITLKKFKKTIKPLEKLIELNPSNILNYKEKSRILISDLKKYKEALNVIEKGLSFDPYNKELIEIKIKTLFYLGRNEEIYEIITNFIPKYVDKPDFHLYI